MSTWLPTRKSRRVMLAVGGAVLCGLVAGSGCGFDAVGSATPIGAGLDASSTEAAVTERPDAQASDSGLLDGAALDAPVEAPSCGDVQTTATNCGTCGHSCLGGTCAAGKCQPVTLVTGDPGLGAVALDTARTTAYYAAENSGVIRKVAVAGGAAVDVFSTGRAPHELAFDGDRLFWGDQFGAGLFNLGNSTNVKLAGSAIRAIAPTSQGPYIISAIDVDIWDRDFGGSQQLFTNTGSSPAIVVDGTYAYWSAGQQIRRVLYKQSTVTNVVTGIGANPTSMAISATHVYWTTATKVQRAAIGASVGWTIETLVSTETLASSLAVDATNAYWFDLTTGAVRRAPLMAGGVAETLAKFTAPQLTDAPYPHQLALTANAICIASTSDGTLSRLAK